METTTPHGAIEGKTQNSPTNFYNLDAIISVGYRVNSIRVSERRIWQQVTDTMEEFAASIKEFLTFRKYEILPDRGKISREMANDKAEQEYEVFNKTQVIESDFDREVKKILTGGKYYV